LGFTTNDYVENRKKSEDQIPEKETGEIPSTQLSYTADVLNGESICPLPSDKNIAPKNEISDAIFEQPNFVLPQQQQQPQKPSEPELGLYQAIVSRSLVLARAVVVFFGLLSFLVLQLLASILSGVFALLIIRNPGAWLIVSLLPWMALAYSSTVTMMQCVRDVRGVEEGLEKDGEAREKKHCWRRSR